MSSSSFKSVCASALIRVGLTANSLTLLGLFFAGLSGWYSAHGFFLTAALALLTSGVLDMMDGAVARQSGSADAFGGILDSTLDRYGDLFIVGGILFYFIRSHQLIYGVIGLIGISGSFAVSYIRARAECEIESCRVGFWERGERIGLLVIGLAVQDPRMALLILAVATQWTAFERLAESRRIVRRPHAKTSARQSERGNWGYLIKVLFWGALAAGIRPPF